MHEVTRLKSDRIDLGYIPTLKTRNKLLEGPCRPSRFGGLFLSHPFNKGWVKESNLLLLYWLPPSWKICLKALLLFSSLPCHLCLLPSGKADLISQPVGPETQHANHNTIFCKGRFNYPVQQISIQKFCITSPLPCLEKQGKHGNRPTYNKFCTTHVLLPKKWKKILFLFTIHMMIKKAQNQENWGGDVQDMTSNPVGFD